MWMVRVPARSWYGSSPTVCATLTLGDPARELGVAVSDAPRSRGRGRGRDGRRRRHARRGRRPGAAGLGRTLWYLPAVPARSTPTLRPRVGSTPEAAHRGRESPDRHALDRLA